MNSIEDIFKKYALSNINDEDTREKLAKNHNIRIKIAEEIVEHIATVEATYPGNENLWKNLESVQGIAAISELIVKNANGSFCDRSQHDWFELDNPYYRLLNFAMDCFISNENIRTGELPTTQDVANLIKKEVIIVNEGDNITELDAFVTENCEQDKSIYYSYQLYINNHYKKKGVKNRVLFAISCLIMLANLQEVLLLGQKNIQKNKQQQSIKLKVTYDKKPPFDYCFYKRAVVIHFKNKENFLNESKFLYEIAREILIKNEPMRIAKTQIKKDGTLVNLFNLLVFNLSKIFLKEYSFTCEINKLDFIDRLNEHLSHHYNFFGRTDLSGQEKAKFFFKLLGSPDVDCIEIINKK